MKDSNPFAAILLVRPRHRSASSKNLATLVLCVFALSFILLIARTNVFPSAQSGGSGTLLKTSSGLVASDPLNRVRSEIQLQSNPYWYFGGDAASGSYSYYEDAGGLHVGAVGTSGWAGYYAVSPNTNFVLVHVRVSQNVSTVPNGSFESGLYVQTYNGLINYVTCVSSTGPQGTYWAVVSALGNYQQANTYQVLWQSSIGQPLAQDCTIVTNGNNYLKVYFGSVLEYESHSLNLQIPPPFQVYLEPESSYNGAILYSTYQNYYVTSSEYVKVNALPSNAVSVELLNASDPASVLAAAPVSGGSASVEVANYLFPLKTIVQAVDSSGNVVASTGSTVGVYGGDVYSYSEATSSSNTSTSNSTTSTSNSNTSTRNSTTSTVISSTTITSTSMDSTSTSTSETSSTASSTSSSTTTSVSTSTTVSSTTSTSTQTTTTSTKTPSSGGTYQLTVNTQDMSGNPIYGYYTVESSPTGQVIATGYSPATFTLNSGQSYVISVDNYGNYVFDHWLDTGSTIRDRTISTPTTSITAVYRNVNSPPPSGNAVLNVATVSTTGQAIDGLYTFVSQNGNILQHSFSTAQFLLAPGTYQVTVDNYGPYIFQWWSTGDNLRTFNITVTGGSTTSLEAIYSAG